MKRQYHTRDEWTAWVHEATEVAHAYYFKWLFGVNSQVQGRDVDFFEYVYVPVPTRFCIRLLKEGTS